MAGCDAALHILTIREVGSHDCVIETPAPVVIDDKDAEVTKFVHSAAKRGGRHRDDRGNAAEPRAGIRGEAAQQCPVSKVPGRLAEAGSDRKHKSENV